MWVCRWQGVYALKRCAGRWRANARFYRGSQVLKGGMLDDDKPWNSTGTVMHSVWPALEKLGTLKGGPSSPRRALRC